MKPITCKALVKDITSAKNCQKNSLWHCSGKTTPPDHEKSTYHALVGHASGRSKGVRCADWNLARLVFAKTPSRARQTKFHKTRDLPLQRILSNIAPTSNITGHGCGCRRLRAILDPTLESLQCAFLLRPIGKPGDLEQKSQLGLKSADAGSKKGPRHFRRTLQRMPHEFQSLLQFFPRN